MFTHLEIFVLFYFQTHFSGLFADPLFLQLLLSCLPVGLAQGWEPAWPGAQRKLWTVKAKYKKYYKVATAVCPRCRASMARFGDQWKCEQCSGTRKHAQVQPQNQWENMNKDFIDRGRGGGPPLFFKGWLPYISVCWSWSIFSASAERRGCRGDGSGCCRVEERGRSFFPFKICFQQVLKILFLQILDCKHSAR